MQQAWAQQAHESYLGGRHIKHDPLGHHTAQGPPATFPTWARILVSVSLVCFGIANVGMNIGILSQISTINSVETAIAEDLLGHLPHKILTLPPTTTEVKYQAQGVTTMCVLTFVTDTATIVEFDKTTWLNNLKLKKPSKSHAEVAREYNNIAASTSSVAAMLVAANGDEIYAKHMLLDGRSSATPITVVSVKKPASKIQITYTVSGGTECIGTAAVSAATTAPTPTNIPISLVQAK